MEKDIKIKYAKKGQKIKVEKCPNCHEEIVIDIGKGEFEDIICENCKFKIEK